MPKSDQIIDQNRYQVVPRTLIFLFDNHNRVLLLKGSSTKKLWAKRLNGIGGHIEAGEDIIESAQRELYEETGIVDLTLQFCAQVMVDVSEKVGVALFIFRGEFDKEPLVSSKEGALTWVALDQLSEFPVVEDLLAIIPRVAVHQSASSPMIGKSKYGPDGELKITFR